MTPKIVQRVEKLVRLAASSSSENEAASAGIEAAKLIVQHRLTVSAEAIIASSFAPPSRASTLKMAPRMTWVLERATADGRCAYCGGIYVLGDEILGHAGSPLKMHSKWPCE